MSDTFCAFDYSVLGLDEPPHEEKKKTDTVVDNLIFCWIQVAKIGTRAAYAYAFEYERLFLRLLPKSAQYYEKLHMCNTIKARKNKS